MILKDKWKLYFVKDSEYKNNIKDISKYNHFDNVSIPTMFELEIYRNGLLGHPYESTNSWDYQKYEDYHQFYVLNFSSNSKKKYIKFKGIDTLAEIYVNDKLIAKVDNMFIEYTFELKNLKKENELIVHILPAVLEGKKYNNFEKLHAFKKNYEGLNLRKSASSFGWDIIPRMALGGIYKEVELLNKLPIIEDVQVRSLNISKEKAILDFKITARKKEKYEFLIEGKCKNSKFILHKEGKITLYYPLLWTIRGFGDQNLYKIKVSAIRNGKVVETKRFNYGIRKIELLRSSVVEPNGKFEFHINDEKVFLLGANWVPVDAIKRVDNEMMLKSLDAMVDLGCNAVRVWGGGTYETDLFYEKCDEYGIFVWQDFMMGCGVYPQDEEFQTKLRKEAGFIVKKLRNHCSICVWAGDNENDLAGAFWSRGKLPPNQNVLTRKVIPSVLKKEDGTRPYLPSSPYIDEFAEKHPELPLSEDHLWGPRDYFKGEYYGSAKCYFTSETGYHAMCNVDSAKKYLKKPWPIFINKDLDLIEGSKMLSNKNLPTKEYLCHSVSVEDDYESEFSYRTVLMVNQVRTLFSNDINNLEDFTLASQISQAEALKYFIERMRKDYNSNGGIIWWDIRDAWPQPADSVIDYYFGKKQSYYYIKRSQMPVLLMMNEDEDGLNLYSVSSDRRKHHLTYELIDGYTGKFIDGGALNTISRGSYIVKKIDADYKTLLIIKYKDEKGNEYINHFHTHIIDIDFNKYVNAMKKYGLFK